MTDDVRPVRLADAPDTTVPGILGPGALPDGVEDALALARDLTPTAATLGRGGTRTLWEVFATLGAHDLGVARTVEPHLDAAAILAQAGEHAPTGTWGVYAAEGGPSPLTARTERGRWTLDGIKPWCSLADRLDHALVTARTATGERGLFAVDLRDPGVRPHEGTWHARGLAEIPSGSVAFDGVPARPVGEAGWYLRRPGFWWGGIGVAACWFGGAVGIARTVRARASASADPHALAHLGAIDTLLHACRIALADAARRVDAPVRAGGELLALRVRGIVARSCEEIVVRAGHVTGPGPLASDARHAKRIADLLLYVRQHHAERDEASQATLLTSGEDAPW